MIRHEETVTYAGDRDSAMNTARIIFMTNGFKVNNLNERQLSLTGPGMKNTKENPIRGISQGTLTFTDHAIEFDGELGGVAFMKRFVWIFPPALGLGLASIFVFTKQELEAAFTPLLTILPWMVLAPVLSKYIQRRTVKAISMVLENLSNVYWFSVNRTKSISFLENFRPDLLPFSSAVFSGRI